MFKGLTEYITQLEQAGELLRIKEPVSPLYEIAGITRRMTRMPNGGKALLFENTGTSFPVLTNLTGSEKRMLYSLGIKSLDEASARIETLIQEITGEKDGMGIIKQWPFLLRTTRWNPKEYKGIPPCQEVVMYKPQLNKLPVLTCWPRETGPCITSALIHTIHPEKETRNLALCRMPVFSENTAGIRWDRLDAGIRSLEDAVENRVPVAVCLGGDPVYSFAATAPLPNGMDPYRFAGFLRNEGVKMAPCLTQELEVPADCDFVIEGYIDKTEVGIPAGTYAEHTGFYSLPGTCHQMHITCISHRKEAVYPAIVPGIPPQEEKYHIRATEKIFLTTLRYWTDPDILDIYSPEEGAGQNFVVVKIKKRYPGQAVKTAHALWGTSLYMLYKTILVVDDTGKNSPDIRNREELAALALKNYIPKRDTHFSRGPLDTSDHAAPQRGFGGKICLDATAKFPEEGAALSVPYKHFIRFIHPEDPVPDDSQIAVILDKKYDPENKDQALWLAGTNTDPIRDARFAGQTLVLDATGKAKETNSSIGNGPEPVGSSDDIIHKADLLWKKLELPE